MSNNDRVLIVIPTYGQLESARNCAMSALLAMPNTTEVVVIDDCSPDWDPEAWKTLPYASNVRTSSRSCRTSSMTQAWNEGLEHAKTAGFKYAVLANSDLLFPHGWWEPMLTALERLPTRMMGPMTNAPGSRPEQDIRRFISKYQPDDDLDVITSIQGWLTRLPTFGKVEDGVVNGFCCVASTETWFAGAYSKTHVFNPKYKLAGNEDEWQKRVEKKGRQSPAATQSPPLVATPKFPTLS